MLVVVSMSVLFVVCALPDWVSRLREGCCARLAGQYFERASPSWFSRAPVAPLIVARESLGCALFSKFFGLTTVLVELDELSSGVPSFLKSDHGKLLRIAILCLVTWVSRGTCVMVS